MILTNNLIQFANCLFSAVWPLHNAITTYGKLRMFLNESTAK